MNGHGVGFVAKNVADHAVAREPGDLIDCCGQCYRLTFEYGAFAAEER